ncbi:MAG TPA: ATP-binding protein [Geminicoccaceae bacterium]|nr:ATP-binding protein [Geminicoccaceae bacterium]
MAMDQRPVIRLSLPAELRFRDVAMRAVAEACRLVGRPRTAEGSFTGSAASTTQRLDLSDRFAAEMVSAVSEIFNNIAIHGYGGSGAGEIAMEMTVAPDHLAIQISDHGTAFDPSQVPDPELDSLPEGGMGIHIAKACVDELDYTPGPPNVWRMIKFRKQARRSRPASHPL